ncbi:NAD-dependent deacylase [Candidatus Mycobacterium methanotrophicum]|uniref:protein acetyllysine N-acetyltransferase n=1 Tax=Candidatus Mycobacterium methanotrophicum TaxID=2943498 RepID=A0ABY4QTU9_9MYCO|nr:NAD-dependent deacylase [Candidatus Mycobacterium methanotrophicum]UQX13195.1 NAD-dependent deacylase [Candidatus Mycobacterium methanotrophicum]UQX13290.1 NAD-dependent deacylase [Candidatus Mycobacterium methanotrophicum]
MILTGAGISAESGLSTFRGPDGLWAGERVESVATPEGFAADPARVQRFYNRLRGQLGEVHPNPAHEALARLECHLGSRMLLVTQNIDDLHQRAGSTRLTAMHGELKKIRHVETGEVLDWPYDVKESETVWRPHVVWFGERTIGLDVVMEKLTAASVFAAVGTSGTVYPASRFAEIAKAAGAVTVEINLNATGSVGYDYAWVGPASQLVPELVDQIITTGSITSGSRQTGHRLMAD